MNKIIEKNKIKKQIIDIGLKTSQVPNQLFFLVNKGSTNSSTEEPKSIQKIVECDILQTKYITVKKFYKPISRLI